MALLKDIPESERPVSRICEKGAYALSLQELLAGIIGTGNSLILAEKLVGKYDGSVANLRRATVKELMGIKGIGKSSAARIKAALELGVRLLEAETGDRIQVRSPADLGNYLVPRIGFESREHFMVIFLNTRNRMIDSKVIYKGTINTTVVRTAEVFRPAIMMDAAQIAVAHNHPSGDPNPSAEDVALTRRLVKVGRQMEITVIDHIVVGKSRWTSLRERGLGFDEEA